MWWHAPTSLLRTCASGEIWDERDDTRHWAGYVYFHQQDTAAWWRTAAPHRLRRVFRPRPSTRPPTTRSARRRRKPLYSADVTRLLDDAVFPVLRRHGIEPQWNRDLGTRILLKNADWYAPIEE